MSYNKLEELKIALESLKAELIMQDEGNALNLLLNGLILLRERNQTSKDKLNQIDATTMEMDGNTSSKEEDELVGALKDEMPDFRENVETNFD